MSKETEPAYRAVMEAIEDKKGIEPVVLDVRGLSSVTDYLVVVTGSSPPHLRALSEEIVRRLKAAGAPVRRASGVPDSGWLVMDCMDVVVHLFTPDVRKYYAIEELWNDAPRPVSAVRSIFGEGSRGGPAGA